MVNLRDEIQTQMKQAMRDKDQVRLAAVRFLWSEIRNEEIDNKGDLTDEQVLNVIAREVKKRKDAIEQMQQVGREEMVTEEQAKLDILMEFMPEQMGREEIEKVVDELMKSGATEFGPLMGQVMAKLKGKADGKTVQEVVKEKLG